MQQLFSQTKVVDTQACHLLRLATKTYLPTPSVEVSAREIERVAEFDQHVERNHETKGVAPSLIIDQVFANSS
jgi:hypothetical protein